MTRRISAARPGLARSSASTSMIHSPRHAAARRCGARLRAARRPRRRGRRTVRAISAERSVVRSSTTTISSAKRKRLEARREAAAPRSCATTSADSIGSARRRHSSPCFSAVLATGQPLAPSAARRCGGPPRGARDAHGASPLRPGRRPRTGQSCARVVQTATSPLGPGVAMRAERAGSERPTGRSAAIVTCGNSP